MLSKYAIKFAGTLFVGMAFLATALTPAIGSAQADPRASLPGESGKYYKAIFDSAKRGNLERARKAMEKLKPLASALDAKYGTSLAAISNDSSKSKIQTWVRTMLVHSIQYSFDTSLEMMGNQSAVRKRIQFALNEFKMAMPYMIKRASNGSGIARRIQSLFKKSVGAIGNKPKFKKIAGQITSELKKAYPKAFKK